MEKCERKKMTIMKMKKEGKMKMTDDEDGEGKEDENDDADGNSNSAYCSSSPVAVFPLLWPLQSCVW